MMLSITMLVPPYWQLKLHIEAQISSGVVMACDQFLQIEPPIFVSINVPGAAEHNQALLEKWRPRNIHL